MKLLIYLIFLVVLPAISWAQSGKNPPADTTAPVNNIIDPNEGIHPSPISVVQPSPEAASLGKYGEVPVSLYTGIPSIQVPQYTITQGALSLATAVNYHAGGVKIDEIASSVGLNWSLSAGGVITRTIHGNPDDQVSGYQTPELRTKLYRLRSGLMTTTERQNFEHDVADGIYDTEPDSASWLFVGSGLSVSARPHTVNLIVRTSQLELVSGTCSLCFSNI